MAHLLDATVAQAVQHGLIDANHHVVAVDSTGYESGHVSPCFARRSGRKQHDFPKLNAAVDVRSHLAVAAVGQRGPAADDPTLHELVDQARSRATFDLLPADAAPSGGDGAPHHRFLHARGIFAVIPPTRGRPRRGPARMGRFQQSNTNR